MEDAVEKMIPQNDGLFSLNLSLVIKPPTSEKFNDSENENLQLQTIQKTNLSVNKQSLHFQSVNSHFLSKYLNLLSFFYLLIHP